MTTMQTTTDPEQFLPLYPTQTESTILARLIADANAGLDPVVDAEQWIDVRPGSFWYFAVMPAVREIARLWDALGTEVPQAGFIAWSWSIYLDWHAEARGLYRLAATPATGEVTFDNQGTADVSIDAGVVVSTQPATIDDEAQEFVVTTAGVVPASGELTLPITASVAGISGNVGPGAITVVQTAGLNVTVSNDNETVDGTDTETDDALRLRIEGQYESANWNVAQYIQELKSYAGVGRARVIAHGRGPGSVLCIVFTATGGPVSAGVISTIQTDLDPPTWRGTLTNNVTLPQTSIALSGGTTGLRPTGIIRIGDQAVQYTGVTSSGITGCSGGSGGFAAGTAVLQSGGGNGRAPIGHQVFVVTGTVVPLTFSATLTFNPGYSLDGGDGTIAIRDTITAIAQRYAATLLSGDKATIAKVTAALAQHEGVEDATDVEINSATRAVTLSANPPQIAGIPTVTLTAA